jgi:hypothetical protein
MKGAREIRPLNGSSVTAPACVTPGSDVSRCVSVRWKPTIDSRLSNRRAGSVIRAETTPAGSNPGNTACTFAKLFASIVTTTSRTTAIETSALTSRPRMR